ncbi:MAG: sulfatase-like hydrolase/transferase, partial [Spirochaetia bacterium]
MNKPNILFIMTDQMRRDAMGTTGGWVKTPNLDRIAGEGVNFSRCVTNSPVCIPARISLAAGRYPHNTGVWHNFRHDMPRETPTWMRAVREAGYRTSVFGKTHLHRNAGDLRDREYLVHAYGLDDVDEIGGPRASARLLSHMTERWQKLGLWEKYQEDYRERFDKKPFAVRPSVLPLEEYADV